MNCENRNSCGTGNASVLWWSVQLIPFVCVFLCLNLKQSYYWSIMSSLQWQWSYHHFKQFTRATLVLRCEKSIVKTQEAKQGEPRDEKMGLWNAPDKSCLQTRKKSYAVSRPSLGVCILGSPRLLVPSPRTIPCTCSVAKHAFCLASLQSCLLCAHTYTHLAPWRSEVTSNEASVPQGVCCRTTHVQALCPSRLPHQETLWGGVLFLFELVLVLARSWH